MSWTTSSRGYHNLSYYYARAEQGSSDHGDRAVRVMHHLVADRAHDQLREPACAARSDNQNVSITGGLDQFLGRKSDDSTHRDRRGLCPAKLAGGLESQFLRGLACLFLVFGVARGQDGVTGPPAHRD